MLKAPCFCFISGESVFSTGCSRYFEHQVDKARDRTTAEGCEGRGYSLQEWTSSVETCKQWNKKLFLFNPVKKYLLYRYMGTCSIHIQLQLQCCLFVSVTKVDFTRLCWLFFWEIFVGYCWSTYLTIEQLPCSVDLVLTVWGQPGAELLSVRATLVLCTSFQTLARYINWHGLAYIWKNLFTIYFLCIAELRIVMNNGFNVC